MKEIENSDLPKDLLLEYAPKLDKLLNEAREAYERTGGIPHKVFWEEIEKKDS